MKTAIISTIVAAIFFILKDKKEFKDSYVIDNHTPYRYIELNKRNFYEIMYDTWKVLIVKEMKKKHLSKVSEYIQTINVALLVVDTFEKAKLATIFGIKELPKDILISDGVISNTRAEVCLSKTNFWRAVEIWALLLYIKTYADIKSSLNAILDDGFLLLSKIYNSATVSNGIVIYF